MMTYTFKGVSISKEKFKSEPIIEHWTSSFPVRIKISLLRY